MRSGGEYSDRIRNSRNLCLLRRSANPLPQSERRLGLGESRSLRRHRLALLPARCLKLFSAARREKLPDIVEEGSGLTSLGQSGEEVLGPFVDVVGGEVAEHSPMPCLPLG